MNTNKIFLQKFYPNSGQGCSYWFKWLYCWTLHIHGMMHGSRKMNRNGLSGFLNLSSFHLNAFVGSVNLPLHVSRYIALLAVSIGCYLAAFTFSGILFMWFNPSGHDCGLNVFFIVMTMILAFAFAVIALHPAVRIRLCFLSTQSEHLCFFIIH